MSNKLTKIAKELLYIEEDLPYRFDYNLKPRATIDDCEVYIFEQVWGSTALGFGGIGGQAMTAANTYVFVPMSVSEKCFVYFAGKFAYAVPNGPEFMEDVKRHQVASVSGSGRYLRRD